VPDKPDGVAAKANISSTSITLSIFDTKGFATHYKAVDQMNVSKHTTFPRSRQSERHTFHGIDGLTPFRNYTFCVYSIVRDNGTDTSSTNCTLSVPIVETGMI
ncbi:unnamed protein product, partial [Owenia fusiformis]